MIYQIDSKFRTFMCKKIYLFAIISQKVSDFSQYCRLSKFQVNILYIVIINFFSNFSQNQT